MARPSDDGRVPAEIVVSPGVGRVLEVPMPTPKFAASGRSGDTLKGGPPSRIAMRRMPSEGKARPGRRGQAPLRPKERTETGASTRSSGELESQMLAARVRPPDATESVETVAELGCEPRARAGDRSPRAARRHRVALY